MMKVEEVMKNEYLSMDMNQHDARGKSQLFDELHLISPVLYELLNLMLPDVPKLQSLEKP